MIKFSIEDEAKLKELKDKFKELFMDDDASEEDTKKAEDEYNQFHYSLIDKYRENT